MYVLAQCGQGVFPFNSMFLFCRKVEKGRRWYENSDKQDKIVYIALVGTIKTSSKVICATEG